MRFWIDKLWGKDAKLFYLFLTASILLFGFLGNRELWTQEHRWADIVTSMFFYHDFFHPILNGHEYYDKPLLSYWFIAGIASLIGDLNLFAMRLPSALAGFLAIYSIYKIGFTLQDKRLGLLAGWLLITTYYFVFWSRVSSADMLNLAGALFAVCWYLSKRDSTQFFNYAVFFIILSVTALCKGLVGAVVAIIAVTTDVLLQKSWKKHINVSMVLSVIPAVILYILPFWFSHTLGDGSYEQSGLYKVYRENIMRYFHPFDHRDPFYIYFIYLPIYLMPWALFFIPAIFSLKKRWPQLSLESKWLVWTTLLLFLFFTLSGSRRSYYILPIVPFAILMIADWMITSSNRVKRLASQFIVCCLIMFAVIFLIFQPWYYSRGGVITFNKLIKSHTTDYSSDKLVLLDAEQKLNYYLKLSPEVLNLNIKTPREKQTVDSLLKTWPILQNPPKDTIFISRKLHEPLLRQILINYNVLPAEKTYLEIVFNKSDPNLPVAFIPKN